MGGQHEHDAHGVFRLVVVVIVNFAAAYPYAHSCLSGQRLILSSVIDVKFIVVTNNTIETNTIFYHFNKISMKYYEKQ